MCFSRGPQKALHSRTEYASGGHKNITTGNFSAANMFPMLICNKLVINDALGEFQFQFLNHKILYDIAQNRIITVTTTT